MKCPECDYALWNIKPGPCPECGQPFQPSDFEFKPGAVAFDCVDCGQSYYGSSRLGHLQPRAFECVGCQRFLEMDAMPVRPAEEFVGSPMLSQVTPWKGERGNLLKRWCLMNIASLGSPVRLAQGLPPDRGLRIGIPFFIVNLIVFAALSVIPFFLLFGIGMNGFGANANGMQFLLVFLGWVGGVALAVTIMVLFSGSVSHLLVGFKGRRHAGISRTLATLLVTSSPMCILAMPCLGVYLAPAFIIWWLVSFALALRHVQDISLLHAFVCAFLPLSLVLLVLVGSLFLIYS